MVRDVLSGRLLDGERVLWSGQPGQGVILTSRDVYLIPFSLVWCGFAIFWEYTVLNGRNAPGFFVLWGAMFVAFGLYLVVGRFVLDAWVRRGMRYAVTDQRALIMRPAPFEKFVTVSLAQLPSAELSERSKGRGSIRFGQPTLLSGGGWSLSLDATPQFLMIDDARRVFDLVQRARPRS